MSKPATPVDLAIEARWVLPMAPDDVVLQDHTVIVDGDVIRAVLPTEQVRARFAPREALTRNAHVVMPGLVNAHTHSPMTLMRGLADDLPLMEWLEQHIWPAEAAIMGPEYIHDGVELAVAEMLLGGTTCLNENYFFPDIIGETCQRLGFRACVGLPVIEHASAWAGSRAEYFERARATHEQMQPLDLISTAMAPHAPYTVDDESFGLIRDMAEEFGIPVHLHLHETAGEVEDSLHQHGVRPLQRLERLGLVNERLIAVHMTAASEAEIARCAEAGVSLVHCPESNLKLASGFCAAEAFRAAGVNLAIGTDGCASNNDLDMFGELRTAALLAKAVASKADAFPAAYALQAATLNGARATRQDERIGSLEAGKQADLIAVSMADELASQPLYDVRSQLVYDGSGKSVSDVWIAGRRQVADGELVNLDKAELLAKARGWRDHIVQAVA